MAHALACIHDHHVIVADVATRNFLLVAYLSINFCDLAESTILPLDSNMQTADNNGYSIIPILANSEP
jgi:hypothetical protein